MSTATDAELFPGIAAKLDAMDPAWIVVRHGGGAAVFFGWDAVRRLLPDPMEEPARFRFAATDQRRMKLGEKSVTGRLVTWG